MNSNSNWTQQRIKEQNRQQILAILGTKPCRFTDLLKKTGYSPRGLTSMLKDLTIEKKIKKTIHEGKTAYTLTKGSMMTFHQVTEIGFISDGIQKDGGIYHHGYSEMKYSRVFSDFPWGIQDDLILDKSIDKKINPITKEIVSDLQEQIYEKIKDNVKNNKIKLDREKKGQIILGFIIDYKKLVESIDENSLEYYKNVTKKELDLLYKIEHETITDKELELFYKLRTRTKEKSGITKK